MTAYRLHPQFILRMTGFPIEDLAALSDPQLGAAVDEHNAAAAAAEQRRLALLDELRARGREARKAREAVERKKPFSGPLPDELTPALARYHEDLAATATRAEAATARYAATMDRGRRHLYAKVREDRFRTVLLMSSPGFEAQLERDVSADRPRNSSIRQLEATLVAYLQRLTTKNETISFYGPVVWGALDPAATAPFEIELDDREIDARATFFERWVCVALADKMAADPEVAPFTRVTRRREIALEGGHARRLTDEQEVVLTDEERAALARADGTLRAGTIAAPVLQALVDKELVTVGLPLAMSLTPFQLLRDEVGSWPAPLRDRWLAVLDELEAGRTALEATDFTALRVAVPELLGKIGALGLTAQKEAQTIYAARLPVNTDCRRAARRVAMGPSFVEQATADLAPWYELWRDLAGLYTTRLHAKMKAVYDGAGGRPLSLGRFFQACEAARLPLLKAEGVGTLPEVEPELQRAWAEQIGARANQPEVTLTDDDLSFVRRRFSFRRMAKFDHPAPDFQLAASEAELREGRWTLVLAETHPDMTPWQNCFSMWCPDLPALLEDYLGAYDRLIDYGLSYPNGPVHTLNRLDVELHPRSTLLGTTPPGRYRTLHPADAIVELTDDDAIVRGPDGAVVGSLLHRWDTAFNTHQLQLLGDLPHAPRLKVGRVVVQREHWMIEPEDELRAAVEEPGAPAFAALRRLRERHGLPEEVFVHPVLPLKFAGHKEGKPTYVDFQSPLLVEGLATRVRGFRRLLITEMLPSTRQCWLRDGRGHYSCEIRCSVRPVTP